MKRISQILICLFVMLLAGSGVANALKCSVCGKEIHGSYVNYRTQYQQATVCEECDRTKPRCDSCNIPHNLRELKYQHGERLCRICREHALYCDLCGKRVEGRYFQFQKSGTTVCGDCYNKYPKCAVCNKPTKPQNIDRETGICYQCLKELPRCKACGKPITGQYFRYEFSDGVFCRTCHDDRPKCYTCGVPVGDRYWKFQDGRVICDECNRKAVIDVKEVKRIMAEVAHLVPRITGIRAMEPYELTVEALNDQSSMAAYQAKKGEAQGSPLYGSELGLYRRMNGKSEIFLLYGLPKEMIYETAAHEYAHAWQAENCPSNQSKELREGFAQWVAAQVLRQKGYRMALQKLEARHDPYYGTGYHRIKQKVSLSGRKVLLEWVKTQVN